MGSSDDSPWNSQDARQDMVGPVWQLYSTGGIKFTPFLQNTGSFDIRHATAPKPRTRTGWIRVELWQARGMPR